MEVGLDEAYLMFHAISVDLVVDLHVYSYCISLNFCASTAGEPYVCIFMCSVALVCPPCMFVF